MGYYFKLGFDFNKKVFETEIVQHEHNEVDKLDWFYGQIDTETIDIVRMTEHVDVVVDDNGLLFPGKPVFEVISPDYPNRPLQLAGILLFGKNQLIVEEGVDTVGFDTEEECGKFANSLMIKLIGITN